MLRLFKSLERLVATRTNSRTLITPGPQLRQAILNGPIKNVTTWRQSTNYSSSQYPQTKSGLFMIPTAPQAQDDAWSYAAQAMRAIYIRTSACDWP